jgi:fructoselysine-6-P-deglycase FrlB-like protein
MRRRIMAYVDAEIASQPECWRRAAELSAEANGLPRRGERVAVVGCGTSWFMAMAYAGLRERAGHGETDAFQASEFPTARRYDRIVAITRSGTTTEVLDLLAAVDAPTTAIVGDPAAPAAEIATDRVLMPFADERSVVQTRFATSALALLRAHLGENLAPVAADAEVAVRAPLPIDPAGIEQATFLGRGWTVGLAQEAALKCREAATFWAEAYQAMDYRHGPISIAAPGRVVWAFGEIPDGLAEDVEATGAAFVHCSLGTGGGVSALDRWAAGRKPLDPMADLILAQRFAVALAVGRGLDPDAPRHLTRSVVLT